MGLEAGETYLLALFLYAIAAAAFLPFPVEALLPFHPEIDPLVKAAVLGLGKGVGAILVFTIGAKANPWLERWIAGRGLWARFFKRLEIFVRRTGWIGLLVLLSIPFMSDTAVNYFYSLLNEEGHALSRTGFVIANVAGGVVRTLVLFWVFS
jgi:membrane protein YqaA with SNARE-associated domain